MIVRGGGQFISSIRSIDLRFVDDLVDFVRGPGFVLDFSDTSFADFFALELKVNIDDPKYAANGGSKGKRLRYFLQNCDDATAVSALTALWEYRSDYLARSGGKDPVIDAQSRYQGLINRLSSGAAPKPTQLQPVVDRQKIATIKAELLRVSSLSAQARGFAFEGFLKGLFDAFGLAAQEPFRLCGEQIDGSFELGNDTYLLEAKWHSAPTPAADLHILNGKLNSRPTWSRALFISYGGFGPDGLEAFNRGKSSLICMDGYDLYETLSRELPLDRVITRKARHAVETGLIQVSVRDLFP